MTTQSHRTSDQFDGVVVLGAGLAGLGASVSLPGSRIYEADRHPGGHAYSRALAGFHFDEGAHIVHSRKPWFLKMIESACPDFHTLEDSNVKNLWYGGWIGYPVQNHLVDLPLDLRVSALSSLLRANIEGGENDPLDYGSWVRASYGDVLSERFYEVFTRKYWRRSASELGVDWLSGRLIPADLENIVRGALGAEAQREDVFARFRYPRKGGFYGFFQPLYSEVNLELNHRAVELDATRRRISFESGRTVNYDQLVSTIPLPSLIGMCKDAPSSIRWATSKLRHTKLLCIDIVVDRPGLTDLHWFYVYDEDIDAARVSLPSNLSDSGTSRTAMQAEIFRDAKEAWNPDELLEQTVKTLAGILRFDVGDVVVSSANAISHAYVVSDFDRQAAVAEILAWLEDRMIFGAGLYGRWQYLWSDQAFESGADAALKVGAARST